MDLRAVVLLCLGHAITDINQGALPALLPFLIVEYRLSYAAAAFIVFAANIASTVVQPLFGHLADRRSTPWIMPGGVLMAGLGLAATGVAPHYGWVLLGAMVSGIGVAAFHPEGARHANRVSGERKATAMSVFGVGGTLGFAIGPPLTTAAVLYWGLRGTLVLALPVAVMALVLLRSFPGGEAPVAKAGGGGRSGAAAEDAWAPFARLTGAVVARAAMFYGFNTFIPLYVLNVLHGSKAAGAVALTAFALAGVAGNLLGGRLADRFGHTRVAAGGFCLLVPLAPTLMLAHSAIGVILLLIPVGFALSSTYSPLVVLGQRYLPNHVGLSAGVTLGIAISIGGVATPLLGRLADFYGLTAALAALAVVPVLSAALAFTLPSPDRRPLPRTAA